MSRSHVSAAPDRRYVYFPEHLVQQRNTKKLPFASEFTTVLGINWNTESDSLHLTRSIISSEHHLTKKMLASSIARVYDMLGWNSTTIIEIKILLEQL